MAVQGGYGQLDVVDDHDETGHLERSACCVAPLPCLYGKALKGRFEDYDLP